MKMKIIKSDDLKQLKIAIIREIDTAQIQAEVYGDEAEQQKHTKQSPEIIKGAERNQKIWLDRRSALHECLVKIEKYSSEIEI